MQAKSSSSTLLLHCSHRYLVADLAGMAAHAPFAARPPGFERILSQDVITTLSVPTRAVPTSGRSAPFFDQCRFSGDRGSFATETLSLL